MQFSCCPRSQPWHQRVRQTIVEHFCDSTVLVIAVAVESWAQIFQGLILEPDIMAKGAGGICVVYSTLDRSVDVV